MNKLHNKLASLRYFLARGPAYHFAYLRWRTARLRQRTFRSDYTARRSDGTTNATRSQGPRFFFTTSTLDTVRERIRASERQQTIAAAKQVCEHRFAFRGSDLIELGANIDWTAAPDDNKDWRWDLNRHAYFETLGRAWQYTRDNRFARAFAALLGDWIAKNPPAVDAPNWSSAFEVGFRINSWSWAYFLFEDCTRMRDTLRGALLDGIGMHCTFLAANLELHARNNHLLLETKALVLGGLLFPGFHDAPKWLARGERLLFREVRNQVLADGVHGEMSTHYHRVIAGELLELLLLYRLNKRPLPQDIEEKIRRMVDFESSITRPDGLLPLFGDSAQEDTYARFSAARAGPVVFSSPRSLPEIADVRESEHWRLATLPIEPAARLPLKSRAFPDGGYYLMQSGSDRHEAMYLAIDCGPFGLASDPHHGHADALAFELFAAGRPWLVDSGVYSTHAPWDWRRYFRGTRSHNTITVDGLDQTVLLDSRRAAPLARAHCQTWRTDGDIEFFDGSHDGYERLAKPVTHRRRIWFVRDQYWLIVDNVTGQGTHDIEVNFHCPDDISIVLQAPGAATLCAPPSLTFQIAFATNGNLSAGVVCGSDDPIQGWRSVNSGQKSAAPTLSLRGNAALPLVIASVLRPGRKSTDSAPSIELDATSVRVISDGRTDRFSLT
ncbi:MAG TPA: alginate lyase family protein [Woeseiaceae bacterium]|nr:alginate lyase family protein [Woeseiaceae bacterium]